MRRIGQHHVALDGDEPVGQLLQERQEGQVGQQHAVLGVVDDPGDLLGEQPRIDRVIDRPDPENAVPGFQMPGGVPGERPHPVAEPDAVAVEALGDLQGAGADLRIVGGHQRAFDRARMDAARTVVQCRVIDDAMAQQRPVLHQSQHGSLPGRRPSVPARLQLRELSQPWMRGKPVSMRILLLAGAQSPANRASPKREISCTVAPVVARSARMSPMAGANLKPWPEQGEATTICGAPGSRSMMKSPSGVMV